MGKHRRETTSDVLRSGPALGGGLLALSAIALIWTVLLSTPASEEAIIGPADTAVPTAASALTRDVAAPARSTTVTTTATVPSSRSAARGLRPPVVTPRTNSVADAVREASPARQTTSAATSVALAEAEPDYRSSRIMEPLTPDGRENQRAHARCLQQVFHEDYGILAYGSIEEALAHCATFLTR